MFLIFCLVELAVAQADQATPRQLGRLLLARAVQAFAALMVYQIAIVPSLKAWTLEHSETIHNFGELPMLWQNALAFWQFVVSGFPARWTQLFAPFAVIAAATPLASAFYYTVAGRDRHRTWQTAILLLAAVLGPLVALVCVAGPMLLLVRPVFVPRVMLGVGALLSGALVVMNAAARPWPVTRYWQYVNAGMWALGMIVCASIYGNALAAQQQYEDRIAAALANDMASLRSAAPTGYYLLDGSAGFSVETARVVAQFPLIGRLVPRYLGDEAVNATFFLSYYQLGAEDLRSAPSANARIGEVLGRVCSVPPLQRRPAYELRQFGDVTLVSFKDSRVAACADAAGHRPTIAQ